jgi:competence protein ComEA
MGANSLYEREFGMRFAAVVAALLILVNLNTATFQELRTLLGIGPSLAKKIIEFRTKKGGFRRKEELLAVPGISEKRWKVLRESVCVESCGV